MCPDQVCLISMVSFSVVIRAHGGNICNHVTAAFREGNYVVGLKEHLTARHHESRLSAEPAPASGSGKRSGAHCWVSDEYLARHDDLVGRGCLWGVEVELIDWENWSSTAN
jgi:hypothetical protein